MVGDEAGFRVAESRNDSDGTAPAKKARVDVNDSKAELADIYNRLTAKMDEAMSSTFEAMEEIENELQSEVFQKQKDSIATDADFTKEQAAAVKEIQNRYTSLTRLIPQLLKGKAAVPAASNLAAALRRSPPATEAAAAAAAAGEPDIFETPPASQPLAARGSNNKAVARPGLGSRNAGRNGQVALSTLNADGNGGGTGTGHPSFDEGSDEGGAGDLSGITDRSGGSDCGGDDTGGRLKPCSADDAAGYRYIGRRPDDHLYDNDTEELSPSLNFYGTDLSGPNSSGSGGRLSDETAPSSGSAPS